MLLQVLRVRDAPGAYPCRLRRSRRRLDEALRRNAKELLVLTGERPEVNPVVAAKLAEWGHDDFTSYVVWACERALERGMLPHTNIGVLDRDDLARLREVTASQGLMLESVSERLMDTVHAGSPTKHPAKRLATIEAAGELKIPFTSGILVGIGETEEERVESLEALAELHERYGHLQEVILQNFVPHPRYYGREVADIADEASRRRWGAGDPSGGARRREVRRTDRRRYRASSGGGPPSAPWSRSAGGGPVVPPDLGEPVSVDDIKRLISGVQAVDAGCGGSSAAEPVRLLGLSSLRRGRRIWEGCRRMGTTSRPSTRSRARMRCGRSLRPRAMR